MRRPLVILFSLCAILVLLFPTAALPAAAQEPAPEDAAPPAAEASGPLFIENVGQFADGARFQMWGGPCTIWLAEDALWMTLVEPSAESGQRPAFGGQLSAISDQEREAEPRGATNLRVSFAGANPQPTLEPFGRLEEPHVSYFLGADPAGWRADVPVWAGVRYRDLYPGIDLVLSGDTVAAIPWRLEASAGADLSQVRLRVEGADEMALTADASQAGESGVRVITALGELTLPLLAVDAPAEGILGVTALEGDAIVAPFAAGFGEGADVVDYAVGMPWATFLGGAASDYGYAVALDDYHQAHVTGATESPTFPHSPGYDPSHNGYTDAFVVKLNATGTGLRYATFVGGAKTDEGNGIAIGAGMAYVVGDTTSSDFPAAGAGGYDDSYNANYDVFVIKLNGSGTALTYATFLGANSEDHGLAIGVDGGRAYVAGWTTSSFFPAKDGPGFDTTYNGGLADGYAVKLNDSGTELLYATFLGGMYEARATAIAVSAGYAYVAGWTQSDDFPAAGYDESFNGGDDVFVIKLDADGMDYGYSTYVGGSIYDEPCGIAVTPAGQAYVTGYTNSSNFPATGYDTTYNGGTDAFAFKLAGDGLSLLYSTFLGGNDFDSGQAIAADGAGQAYVVGRTDSTNFTMPLGPGIDKSANGGTDGFAIKLSPDGASVLYSTFLGGTSGDYAFGVAVDNVGQVYVAGETASANFPATLGPGYDRTYNGGSDAWALALTTPAIVQRVNCGGGAYTDTAGNLWDADRMFSEGSWGAIGGASVTTFNNIANTEDDPLYQSDRTWQESASPGYRFSLPNGAYEITFKFAETLKTAADQRKFSVRMEGIQVLTRYDIYSVAGAKNKAVADRLFVINVADGVLDINFTKVIDKPKINAIQIKQLTGYELLVNCGGSLVKDSAGKTWRSDKNYGPGSWGYTAGSVRTTTAGIANTVDDALYQSERQWSSSAEPGYRFAVPNGTYDVTFKFAETAYAAADKRVFSVKLEGATKLEEYDIFAAAGAKNKAAPDQTFSVQVTDGELTVDFIQVVGAPKVNAIRLKRTGD